MFSDKHVGFDLSRGVDVMRGDRVLWHFVGPMAYLMALSYAEGRPGAYIRYWDKKKK